MKYLAFLLMLAPAQAWAVDGYTILKGPEVPIIETVGQGFPRYDMAASCKTAWPGDKPTTQAARSVCQTRQNRIAGLTSQSWNDVPAAARLRCVQRADEAGSAAYSVLFHCVHAALYTARTQETKKDIANLIRKQNGIPSVDNLSVGSIR